MGWGEDMHYRMMPIIFITINEIVYFAQFGLPEIIHTTLPEKSIEEKNLVPSWLLKELNANYLGG